MPSKTDKLLKKHEKLVQSDMRKVLSHVQRVEGDWFLNTLMIDGCDAPFKYKRKQRYKTLTGQRVNMTYYPVIEEVAGIEFEVMKVVRVRIA
ncbi:MAG: hypothetical protein GY814_07505 [Gammaproteobacteria bacterium]|nr:hypothetical protein [Gammaproteobacteria bacterium]